MVNPAFALILEVDIVGDIPRIAQTLAPIKMDNDPTLLTYDRSMIPNPRLKNFVFQKASETNISLQLIYAY